MVTSVAGLRACNIEGGLSDPLLSSPQDVVVSGAIGSVTGLKRGGRSVAEVCCPRDARCSEHTLYVGCTTVSSLFAFVTCVTFDCTCVSRLPAVRQSPLI